MAVGRFFMRNYQLSSDSSRIFAALSRLCQAPVSWYSSGPAQKYILRHIRLVDQAMVREGPAGSNSAMAELSVSLNMLYGSILFTSTSYTHSLSRFTVVLVLQVVVAPTWPSCLADTSLLRLLPSCLRPAATKPCRLPQYWSGLWALQPQAPV